MAGKMGNDGRNRRAFRWSAEKHLAAELVAADDLTDEQIAERVGIPRSTLHNWKTHPDFAAKVKEHGAAIEAKVRGSGICNRVNRLRALADRVNRMNRVIHQRAADPKMQNVPGGDTGLMVHNVKSIPGKEGPEAVDLYEVDTGLLKELRDHEKQVAQELGEWTDKHDMTSGGEPLKQYVNVNVDEV